LTNIIACSKINSSPIVLLYSKKTFLSILLLVDKETLSGNKELQTALKFLIWWMCFYSLSSSDRWICFRSLSSSLSLSFSSPDALNKKNFPKIDKNLRVSLIQYLQNFLYSSKRKQMLLRIHEIELITNRYLEWQLDKHSIYS